MAKRGDGAGRRSRRRCRVDGSMGADIAPAGTLAPAHRRRMVGIEPSRGDGLADPAEPRKRSWRTISRSRSRSRSAGSPRMATTTNASNGTASRLCAADLYGRIPVDFVARPPPCQGCLLAPPHSRPSSASSPGSETVLVEIRLKPKFSRSVVGSDLRLFRGRRDPSVVGIGIVPGA